MTQEPPTAARTVIFVSDGTAITAETMGRAVLTQFDQHDFVLTTMPFIDSPKRAEEVAQAVKSAWESDGVRPIVFSTLVQVELLKIIATADPLILDLFVSFSDALEKELDTESTHVTGRYHGLTDPLVYDTRMEAVNFALQHDDGASIRHYEKIGRAHV